MPNNSAHLNIRSFSLPAFMDNYTSLINELIVVIKIDVVWNRSNVLEKKI